MITQDDIEEFSEQTEDARAAADEFVRRARKGIPADRWGSTNDMHLVAQGIGAYRTLLALTTDVLIQLVNAERQRGLDAMQIHPKDERNAVRDKTPYEAGQ